MDSSSFFSGDDYLSENIETYAMYLIEITKALQAISEASEWLILRQLLLSGKQVQSALTAKLILELASRVGDDH